MALLGSPPGKAVSIQATASQSVTRKTIVKTADGKFYAYQQELFSHWVETTWSYPVKTDLSPTYPGFDRLRPSLPHAIVDCAGYFTWEWQTTEVFFAVLDDGSVWRWRYGIGLLKYLVLIAIVTVLGAVSGFLLSRSIRKLIRQYIK